MTDSNGPPPHWPWKYQVDWWIIDFRRRISQIEKARGNKTTATDGERRRWEARDWLMTGAGITLILGSLSEKSGVTAAGAMLLKAVVRLYGQK